MSLISPLPLSLPICLPPSPPPPKTQVADKKTTFKVNYLTATKGITGEVISQLAPNKRGTVAFTDKQVSSRAGRQAGR
jgi:hypothetical protein